MLLDYTNDGVLIDLVNTGSPIALTRKLYQNMLLQLKTKYINITSYSTTMKYLLCTVTFM